MSKLSPNFIGHVKNGKFVAENQDAFSVWMMNLDEKECILSIIERKYQRTMPQNNYLHVILKIVAQHNARTIDEEKLFFANLFIDGRSTTSLTTDEMSDYIEEIKRWSAMELGCFIPEPEYIKE